MSTKAKTGMHLYVMQAATGRIKIGRSSDPNNRRRALETAAGQPIFLLKVLTDRGPEERAIHNKLAMWREFGEWFANTGPSRMAIGEAIGGKINFRIFEDAPVSQAIARARAQEGHDAAIQWLAADILANPSTKRRRLMAG